jgi:protein-tyrosine-phosphatase
MSNHTESSRLSERLRSVARAIRYLPDRVLHSGRRSAARRRVLRASPYRSVVFICYGNVCRSPFARAVFDRSIRVRINRPVAVTSAGFIGPDRQPPQGALEAALRRGFDMSDHRSTLITPATITADGLFVVVSKEQESNLITQFGARAASILVLGDLDPQPISRRTIVDPWGRDDAVFDESYDRIARCVEELVRLMEAQSA